MDNPDIFYSRVKWAYKRIEAPWKGRARVARYARVTRYTCLLHASRLLHWHSPRTPVTSESPVTLVIPRMQVTRAQHVISSFIHV